MTDMAKDVGVKVAQEVSDKVKSAITAKLVEMDVYVDHELVEYIMVLVANKKKRMQMEEDLSLFLEDNTKDFTMWLKSVLRKLDAAAILPASNEDGDLDLVKKPISPELKKMEVKKIEAKKPEVKKVKVKKPEPIEEYIPLPPDPVIEPLKSKIRQPIKFETDLPSKPEKKEKKKKKDKEKKKKEKKEKKKKKDKDKDKDKEKHKDRSGKSGKNRHKDSREGSMPNSPKHDILDSLKMNDNLSPPNIFITVKQDCGDKVVNTTKPPTPVNEPSSKESSYHGSPKLRDADELIEENEVANFTDSVSDLRPSEADFSLDASHALDEEESDSHLSEKKENERYKKIEANDDSRGKENSKKSSQISPISETESIHEENDDDGVLTVTRVAVDSDEDTELSEYENDEHHRKITSPIKPSILDRLGPATQSKDRSGGQRIINLREESSFPTRHKEAPSSRSILRANGHDEDRPKRLEARVRPLVSTRQKSPPVRKEVSLNLPRIVSKIGAVVKRAHSDEEDDYHDENSSNRISGVVSKVEIAPRPKRPKSQVANTNLIMRAVADAHKSVNKQKRKDREDEEEEIEEEGPKKRAFYTQGYINRKEGRYTSGTKSESHSERKLKSKVKKISIPPSSATHRREKHEAVMRSESSSGEEEDSAMEDIYDEMEDVIEEVEVTRPYVVKSHITKPPQSKETLSSVNSRYVTPMDTFTYDTNDLRSKLSAKPKLGLPRIMAVPQLPQVPMEDEYIDEVEEWVEEEETMEVDRNAVSIHGTTEQMMEVATLQPQQTQLKTVQQPAQQPATTATAVKKETRCHFWPSCALKEECPFFHPTEACTNFPSCKFGAYCMYVHPTCLFNGLCTKPKCPYVHTVKRNPYAQPAAAAPVASSTRSLSTTPISEVYCRYFPKCTDYNCPFKHPAGAVQQKKNCMYGKLCQNVNCSFQHMPSTSKLKWIAPSAQPKPVPGAAIVPGTAPVATTNKTVVFNKPVLKDSVVDPGALPTQSPVTTTTTPTPVDQPTTIVSESTKEVSQPSLAQVESQAATIESSIRSEELSTNEPVGAGIDPSD